MFKHTAGSNLATRHVNMDYKTDSQNPREPRVAQ